MSGKCEDCKWWEEVDFSNVSKENLGYCHRFPPSEISEPDSSIDISDLPYEFIVSKESDWCGEFERPLAVIQPPTKEEIEEKKRKESGLLTDEELRKQIEKRTQTVPGGY